MAGRWGLTKHSTRVRMKINRKLGMIMTFGELIREMRYSKGVGIKKLAEELDVNYTYLSKIENDKAVPSEKVIERVSKYFNYNKDELMLSADRIPDDIKKILRENPKEAIEYLREQFVGKYNEPDERATPKIN
jgi:HTH-type transcriptional regulator, competence development regulator